MPTEYVQHHKLSEKTDAYALGIVLLELLTGLYHMLIVEPLYDDHEYLLSAHALADARAGAWAEQAAKGLVAVAAKLVEHRVRMRATVIDVRPELEALAARFEHQQARQ
jgi:hypothetical protein